MNIIFKKLASLTVWHDYLLPEGIIRNSQIPEDYSISEYLEIIPTKETAKKLRNLKIRLRNTSKGIDFYAESEKIGNSFFPINIPADNLNLSFDVIVKNPHLYSVSIFNTNRNKMYAVSNFNIQNLTVDDGNGGTEETLYLNKSIDAHLNATTYRIDDFVTKTGNTFLSLQGNNDKATSNTSFWKNLGTTSFISKKDSYDFNRNILRTPSAISVKGKSIIVKNNINDEVVNIPFENSLNDIAPIDIWNFENGLYHLFIDNVLESSFIKNDASRQTLGSIEIAIQGNPTSLNSGVTALTKQQMLVGNGQDGTQNGEILENIWVMRIMNRSTYWKYIFNKEQTFSNTDLATAGLEKLSTTELQTLLPKELAEKGVEIDPGLGFLLPNPSTDSIKILYDLNKNVEKYVSEIYINI